MIKQFAVLAVLALLFVTEGCQSNSSQTEVAPKGTGGIANTANIVAEGVGTVLSTFTEGTKGPVLVFQEFHTSRVGQIEIAVMLLRLREQFGVKKVGLEGAIQSPRALDATWFHHAGGDDAKSAREDTAVRMLGEGEISSAEALALIFSDEEVYGIERADLYNREFDTKINAAVGYLVPIAEKNAERNLSETEIKNLNRLMTEGKQQEALDLLINSDPWTREQYKSIKASSEDNATVTPCEVMGKRVRDLQAKADQLAITVDPEVRTAGQQTIGFYEACHERSIAMVARTVDLNGTGSSTPVAMIIGAAHTDGVSKLLKDQNVSFAVISPIALNPKYGSLSDDQFARKNDSKWARNSRGTLGSLLNAPGKTQGAQGGRKPPPMIGTTTEKSYQSAEFAGMLIAKAARERKRVPDDVWDRIKDLPEFTVERTSFVLDGDDVIYQMKLKKTDGTEVPVWARVGTTNTPEEAKALEQKLLQARVDLGGNGRIPPTQPPSNSTAATDEGPADGKRDGVVISRTGLKTLAVFGTSKADVVKVGKISG